MRLIAGNALNTLAQQGLNPKEDIGSFLTEIIPTWNSWYYDEVSDILIIDFEVIVSPRVNELGTVIENGYFIR